MPSSTKRKTESRSYSARDNDEDDSLTEVGEDHDFTDVDDDELDAIDRRRDPLRQPH